MAVWRRTRLTIRVLFGAGLAAVSFAVVIENPLRIYLALTIGATAL
jgi:hypothetical protein